MDSSHAWALLPPAWQSNREINCYINRYMFKPGRVNLNEEHKLDCLLIAHLDLRWGVEYGTRVWCYLVT
jgi:hypothetical protein